MPGNERPLNVYGYSKLAFDQHVRSLLPAIQSPVVGLRYFNVFGPREQHKGRMMSVLHQLLRQLQEAGACRLFRGTDGFGDGEQQRDFIYVGDVVSINLHFGGGDLAKGILNAGTGRARSFNDIAKTLIAHLGRVRIDYIPFPDELRGKYQSFTQADVRSLRAAGYTAPFTELEEGIAATLADFNGLGHPIENHQSHIIHEVRRVVVGPGLGDDGVGRFFGAHGQFGADSPQAGLFQHAAVLPFHLDQAIGVQDETVLRQELGVVLRKGKLLVQPQHESFATQHFGALKPSPGPPTIRRGAQ